MNFKNDDEYVKWKKEWKKTGEVSPKEEFVMWDIDSAYLQEDETIEYTDRPSMLSCLFSYIWVGLMVFFLIIALLKAAPVSMLIPVVVFMLPSIYFILKKLSTRYAISNKGLLIRIGIITNSIKTVPFKHITSIEVKEDISGKICHYAHILIDTSGTGREIEMRWNYVRAAHKVKKLIDKHLVN